MRGNFDQSIKMLKCDVVDMMDKVYKLLQDSIDSLVMQDSNLARELIKLDNEVDNSMHLIEEKVVSLIALQQPMAKDLRILFAISKIITDLERIGDFCVNIAKITIKIENQKLIKPLIDVPKMQEISMNMLKKSKDSFILEDSSVAFSVKCDEDEIDRLYKCVYSDVLSLIHEDKSNIDQGTQLLFIGRHLERIGDHITNICEKIIYICKGEIVQIN